MQHRQLLSNSYPTLQTRLTDNLNSKTIAAFLLIGLADIGDRQDHRYQEECDPVVMDWTYYDVVS